MEPKHEPDSIRQVWEDNSDVVPTAPEKADYQPDHYLYKQGPQNTSGNSENSAFMIFLLLFGIFAGIYVLYDHYTTAKAREEYKALLDACATTPIEQRTTELHRKCREVRK